MTDDQTPDDNVTAGEPVAPWRDPKCDRLPGESRRQMQKRLGRKGGRPRNPMLEARFRPTDQDREVVKLLSGFGLPLDKIARAVRNPATKRSIAVTTLQERFPEELEQGRAVVDQLLAGTLIKKLREGNIVAAIWMSKNLWGWADRVEKTGHTEVDMNIAIDPADLERRLRERGLPLEVFGIDKPTLTLEQTSGNGSTRGPLPSPANRQNVATTSPSALLGDGDYGDDGSEGS
jgi:hypothetical protein